MGEGNPVGWLAPAPFLLLFLGISISPRRTPTFSNISLQMCSVFFRRSPACRTRQKVELMPW